MKSLLCYLFIASFYGQALMAQEGSTETKPDGEITTKAKKVLRKVGRKVRDTSCEMAEDKAKCESEKLEHAKANMADELDTKKRKMDKATQEYNETLEKKKMMGQ